MVESRVANVALPVSGWVIQRHTQDHADPATFGPMHCDIRSKNRTQGSLVSRDVQFIATLGQKTQHWHEYSGSRRVHINSCTHCIDDSFTITYYSHL